MDTWTDYPNNLLPCQS